MRSSTIKQIQRYLLASWIIGSACLVFAFWYIHGELEKQDCEIMFFTIAVTGGVMWSMVDFCKFEERMQVKKRGKVVK